MPTWRNVVPVTLVLAVVIFLVAVPLGMLLFSSFRAGPFGLPLGPRTFFTFGNYLQVFTHKITYTLFVNTLIYGFASLALGFSIAVALSWIIERTDIPLKRALTFMILLPIGLPFLVIAIAWVILANPTNGILNIMLRGSVGSGPLNIYFSLAGMIWVTGIAIVPISYLAISGFFGSIDRTLEEASLVAGASNRTTARRVTFPLLLPGLISAAIYFLIISLTLWDIPAIVGVPRRTFVFSTFIVNSMQPVSGLPNYGEASAYSIFFFISAGILIFLYGRFTRNREKFATIRGKAFRANLLRLGKYKYIVLVGFLAYFVFATALPLSAILYTSFIPFLGSSRFTLLNYIELLSYPGVGRALLNSLIVTLVSATIASSLAFIISWLAVTRKQWYYKIPDRITFFIAGIPGIILASALLLTYIYLPIHLYGTIWVIIIGESTLFIPFPTRVLNAAFLQIGKELEEASSVSGAGLWTTLRRVVVPLISPTLMRAWIWAALSGIKEAPVAYVLYTGGNQTLAVIMYLIWINSPNIGEAAALAVVLTLISMMLSLLLIARRGVNQLSV